MNTAAMSARRARPSTRAPSESSSAASQPAAPHCPGDTQTSAPPASRATMARFAGLKTCLPRTRRSILEAIAMVEDAAQSAGSLVRSRRLRESPVMTGLSGSKGRRRAAHRTAWARSAAMMVTALCSSRAPKSNQAMLAPRSSERLPIWNQRGSSWVGLSGDRACLLVTGSVRCPRRAAKQRRGQPIKARSFARTSPSSAAVTRPLCSARRARQS